MARIAYSLHAALSVSSPFGLIPRVTGSQPRTVSLNCLINMRLVATYIFSIKIRFSPLAKLSHLVLACFYSGHCHHQRRHPSFHQWLTAASDAPGSSQAVRHTSGLRVHQIPKKTGEETLSLTPVEQGTSRRAERGSTDSGAVHFCCLTDTGRTALASSCAQSSIWGEAGTLQLWAHSTNGVRGQTNLE